MLEISRQKSSYSTHSMCVEVTPLPNGEIAITNSRYPVVAITFTHDEMAAFVAGVKNGDFDELLGLSIPAETEPLVSVAD